MISTQGSRDHAQPLRQGGRYRQRFFEAGPASASTTTSSSSGNEELKRRPDLHAVVDILLLHQITGEMYLTQSTQSALRDELEATVGASAQRSREGCGGQRPHAGPGVRRCAWHHDPERRRLLRLGADGSRLQLLTPTGSSCCARSPGPVRCWTADGRLDGRTPLELPAHGSRGLLRLYISPPRWAKAWPITSSTRRPICCSPARLEDNPDRRTACRGYSIDRAIAELLRQRACLMNPRVFQSPMRW